MDVERYSQSKGFNSFYFVGIPLAILILISTIIMWVKLKESEQNNVNHQLQTAILLATTPLQNHVINTIQSLDRMGQRWVAANGLSEKIWRADAESYYKTNASLEALSYVDASMRIKRIVPEKYKNYIGYDLSKISARFELLKNARDKKSIYLSKLVPLIQGPKGFLIVDPLFFDHQFDGYLLMSINVANLLHDFFEKGFGENFGVSIYQDGTPIYAVGPPVSNAYYVSNQKIRFYNVTWDMYIWPTQSFLDKIISRVPNLVYISGVVTALFFLIGFYFFYESKQSKQETEHLALHLQKILDTVNEGFITIDQDFHVLYMNDYAVNMLGWSAKEAIGKNIQDIVIPERFRGEHKAAMRKYFAYGDESMMNKEIEFLAVTKEGREFPVEIILFPVTDGEQTTFHAFIRDISARKKAELDQARFASIIAASDDAIISADLHGVIKTWNPGAERLFGYQSREAVGQLVSLIYEQPEMLDEMLEKIKEGHALNMETYRKHKDGHLIPVSILISPIKNAAGKVVGGASILRDITERKKIDKMKDEFISIVSHELRTPLTSIRGSLGILESGKLCEVNEKAHQLLQIANNNCERLVRLINDILDIEKIAAGKMNFNFKLLNLYSLVKSTIDSTQGMGTRNNVNIKLEGDKDIEVFGDQDRLTQVITNLLSNAISYSPPEATIEVSLTKDTDQVKVAIKDHGPGIPPGFHDKIFNKFSQADSSDTRKLGGTGLGLSISKAIIERHHGTIGFDTIEGKGTTFYFILPYNELI